jgi:hypothetical protein
MPHPVLCNMFPMIFRINSDYFPKQHLLIGIGGLMQAQCFLLGRKRIFKCYLD